MRKIRDEDRERVFGIMNHQWHGIYSDEYSGAHIDGVDCVRYTRPFPHPDGRDTYYHWVVVMGDGRSVAVATDDPGERLILHSCTEAPFLPVSYEDYEELEMRPPHCDPRVVHAPKQCKICDEHAGFVQSLRDLHDVSFTGKTDRRWPCPADVARPNGQNQVWFGNQPKGAA